MSEAVDQLTAWFDALIPMHWTRELERLVVAKRATTPLTKTELLADPRIHTMTVFAGDLHVKADFSFNNHILVLGDLKVDGVITASPEHAILLVAGNVECRAMNLTRAYLYVTGDVTAHLCFFGAAYGQSGIAGKLRTRVFLHESWENLDVDGREADNVVADVKLDPYEDELTALRAIVLPEVLGAEEFDPYDFLARIADRQAVFLDDR